MFEETGNAKVNEIHMPTCVEHHIGGFEVAEDNRWLACMQILQYITELHADIKYLLDRQCFPTQSLEHLFQRLPLNELHHEVGATCIGKVFMNMGQVIMLQAGQQQRFTFEGLCRDGQFLWLQCILAHLLHCHQPIAQLHICSFIYSPKTTTPHLTQDDVAASEYMSMA